MPLAQRMPILAAALFLALTLGSAGFEAPRAGDSTGELTEPLVRELEREEGRVTPALRESFLREAEGRVAAELAQVGVTLSRDEWATITGDPEARGACLAAVWPPDPRIALNYLEARQEVGHELAQKLRSYLLAGAVARRHVGLGQAALGEKEEWALRGKALAEERGAPRHWPPYARFKVRPPSTGGQETGRTEAKSARREAREEREEARQTDAEGLRLAAGFLKTRNLSPAQVMASAELREELLKAMGSRAPEAGKLTHELMWDIMGAAGLRPAARDPFPSLAEFCRHLATVRTQFPVESAPWPILMPLAKGWPTREAEDIARRAASGKLPTYGNYQGKEAVLRARLEPLPWHWDSWQGTFQAGGVCHEMSTLGVGAYQSVGVPATKTGQPHHSCVTIVTHGKEGYSLQVKQGTKGPSQTRTQWLFADPQVERPLAYPMGLALAMNEGLESYLDSRIGVHLARQLAREGKQTLALATLRAAARRNPFNTEAWNGLAELESPGNGPLARRAATLRLLCERVGAEDEALTGEVEREADTSLAEQADEEITQPRSWRANYVQAVAKTLLLPGIKPSSDPEENRRALADLLACQGKAAPVAEPIGQLQVAAEGWLALRARTLAEAETYAKGGGDSLADLLLARVRAMAAQAGASGEFTAWLAELERATDDRMTSKARPRARRTYGDPLYREVNAMLADRLEQAGRKAEAEALRAKLAEKVRR